MGRVLTPRVNMHDDPFLVRVREAIVTQQLLSPHQRVVVAVSGGADSVALLHALSLLRSAWHLTLHIAHLDHGLRETSADDAAFVRELGERLRVPTTIERRDVRSRCQRDGWSLEDGARRLRYQFFLEVAQRQSAHAVALAHTADDQAETVLMRLMRGAGLLGLGAIPIKRKLDDPSAIDGRRQATVWVVRPMLGLWRREVLTYLARRYLTYRDDATNRDAHFVRNRIRHELLPLLEHTYNPNIKEVLAHLAEQSRWDYAYLQQAAERQWRRTVKVTPSQHVAIIISAWRRQPKALQRQLVRQAIQRVRGDLAQFEFRHWFEVERLLTDRPVGTVLDLPGGVRLRRERDRVVCAHNTRAGRELCGEAV